MAVPSAGKRSDKTDFQHGCFMTRFLNTGILEYSWVDSDFLNFASRRLKNICGRKNNHCCMRLFNGFYHACLAQLDAHATGD